MNLHSTLTAAVARAQHWDIAVIGAGPAGALAALLLARAGRRVLLVERKTFPRAKVCGGCLSAAGVQLLDRLSLAAPLREQGALPLRQLQIRAGNACAELSLPGGMSVSRATLDAFLVAQAVSAGATFLPATTARISLKQRYEVALHQDGELSDANVSPLRASVVLVADGLGHPSLRDCDRFPERVQRRSRIGAACVLPQWHAAIPAATVSMNVNRHGYVGLVHIEQRQTCIAAALDADFVRDHHSLPTACAAILRSTGIEVGAALAEQTWLGAPQLTRTTLRHADQNVFLLGDASGYVEPFTGEGMTWAMMAATEVLPFVEGALAGRDTTRAWTQHVQQRAAERQHWCRTIAYGLRSPWLTHRAVQMLQVAPRLAQPVVHWITKRRLPELAQVIG